MHLGAADSMFNFLVQSGLWESFGANPRIAPDMKYLKWVSPPAPRPRAGRTRRAAGAWAEPAGGWCVQGRARRGAAREYGARSGATKSARSPGWPGPRPGRLPLAAPLAVA